MSENDDGVLGWLQQSKNTIDKILDFCTQKGYGPDVRSVLLTQGISPLFYYGKDAHMGGGGSEDHKQDLDNGLQTRQKIVSFIQEKGLRDSILEFSIKTNVLEITFKSFPDNIRDYTGVIKRFGGVYDGDAKVWRIPISG